MRGDLGHRLAFVVVMASTTGSARAQPQGGGAEREGDRSMATSLNATLGKRCTLPADAVLRSLRRHEADSPFVGQLLREPWFEPLLRCEDAFRNLFKRASRGLKEATEAYAATAAIRRMLDESGSDAGATGRGLCVFDVCSGRGIAATLMSLLLPDAQVLMLDVDGRMDLSHVAKRPNLRFAQVDLFASSAVGILEAESRGCERVIAVGMHLCGALSPRLVALFAHVEAIDGVVLCPCCLKGSLGSAVKEEAKAIAKAAKKEAKEEEATEEEATKEEATKAQSVEAMDVAPAADAVAAFRNGLLGQDSLLGASDSAPSELARASALGASALGDQQNGWRAMYEQLVDALGAILTYETAATVISSERPSYAPSSASDSAQGNVAAPEGHLGGHLGGVRREVSVQYFYDERMLSPANGIVSGFRTRAAQGTLQTAQTLPSYCNPAVQRMLQHFRVLDGATCVC